MSDPVTDPASGAVLEVREILGSLTVEENLQLGRLAQAVAAVAVIAEMYGQFSILAERWSLEAVSRSAW